MCVGACGSQNRFSEMWIYSALIMSRIHAHRFCLGDSVGSAGLSDAQLQNLYNTAWLRL